VPFSIHSSMSISISSQQVLADIGSPSNMQIIKKILESIIAPGADYSRQQKNDKEFF
jgi:hypothetical protein